MKLLFIIFTSMYSFKFDVGLQLLRELNIDKDSLRSLIDIIKSQDSSQDESSYASLYSHQMNMPLVKHYMENIQCLLQKTHRQDDEKSNQILKNGIQVKQEQEQENISSSQFMRTGFQQLSDQKQQLKWYALRNRCINKAIKMDELLHPIQIVKTHQLCQDGLTLHRFLSNEYIVTAADDGFVKLWKITSRGLDLQALLLCSATSSQIESLEVSSDKFTIAAQFYNYLVIWQLNDFLFNPKIVYQPVFEIQMMTKKYFQKRLIQDPDVVNNIHLIDSRFLVWESKSQIILVDIQEQKLIPIFEYLYPSCDQFISIGWSCVSDDNSKLLFIYSQDEMQYVGVVELKKVIEDIKYQNTTGNEASNDQQIGYVHFCQYEENNKKRSSEPIKPMFQGQIQSDYIYFIQVDFPEEARVNLENQMVPNFSRIQRDFFIFCYDNSSHFFIFLVSDVEAYVQQKRDQIFEKQLNQQNKNTRKSSQKNSKNTQVDQYIQTDRLQVSMIPYAFTLAGINLPADLSELCIYSVDDIKISQNNYACCQITVRNAIMHKQMTLFYDLNQILSTRQYYYPINKILLNGFGGAGISNQLLKLQNELDIVTFRNTLVRAESLWIISDAYNPNSIQDQYSEHGDPEACMQFEASDQFIYVFNESGDELILAYRFPTDNYECDNQFSTIQCNNQGYVCLSNNLGFLFLLGPTKLSIEYTLNYNREIEYTEQSFKEITPSSQFYLMELPGLSNFKFNRIKQEKKRKKNDTHATFTKECFIDLFITENSILHTKNEIDIFQEHLKIHEVPYKMENNKITVLLSNQLLLIILTLYMRKNFPYLKNVEKLNLIQQTARHFDRESNKYHAIQQFAQLPCFYQIVKQLFNNASPTIIVNEKQLANQEISKYNAQIIQQIIHNHQKEVDFKYNYEAKEENVYQTLKLPPSFINRYSMVVLEQLDQAQQEEIFRTNIQQLENRFRPIIESIQEFNLEDFVFVNCNVSRNSSRYKPYSQLNYYVAFYQKIPPKYPAISFNPLYEIPHSTDLGTVVVPEKSKKEKQQKAQELSPQTVQESYTEEYVADNNYTSEDTGISYEEYESSNKENTKQEASYDSEGDS